MKNRTVMELIMLVRSCQNNLKGKYKHTYDKDVERYCVEFCKKHCIKITHGSAFKELRHKTYYYIDKNVQSIINNGTDLYNLRENKIITDKVIVDKLMLRGGQLWNQQI